jgi:predicted membrane-bound spermidine synthase
VLRALAILLTVATGTSGLVYEVTWERMLAVLLGSHAEATAAVLAFFLGGLAIGYSLFGRLSLRITSAGNDTARRLLLAYGAIEAGIGFYALAFEPLFGVARAISPLGPQQAALAFAWDAALAAALILPGSILMGATIPFLTQALPADVRDATRTHAAIYGGNTLGAFIGALSAIYFLIPTYGLGGTLRVMAMVNLAAGLCFALLAGVSSRPAVPAPAASTGPRLKLGSFAIAACLLGAAMMTLQTAMIRLGGLSLGASLFTFANVVAVFVLCIAIGSLGVGMLSRTPAWLLPVCTWLLFGVLLALYPVLDNTPYFAHVLRSFFRNIPEAFLPFHIALLLALLVTIGPAVALSGATLPLIFDRLRREHGELGDAAGRLYGWNTAGSLLGALFGGYALYYWLDLHHMYRLALAAVAIAAALLTPAPVLAGRRLQPAMFAVPALILLVLLPAWSPKDLALGAFRLRRPIPWTFDGPTQFATRQWGMTKLAFADDDPTANIVVTENPGQKSGGRAILTNGKSDGSIVGDYTTMALTGLLPAWMSRGAERSFVVGYGTGVTAGEIAALDESKEVIVAEISPGIAAAAPLFDDANLGASKHPEVQIVRGDAYRVLLRAEGKFDVIVSEPSNPWVNGVEMLYTVEFLQAVKDHLAPGGVFCQWFHTYETDRDTIALVLRTYAHVFDHVAIWYGLGTDLFLMAYDDPNGALDLPRLIQRAERPDYRAGFQRAGADTFTEILAHELWPVGVLHAMDLKGPLHTLLHPRLSFEAARAFYMGQNGELPSSARADVARIGAANAMIHRYTALRGGLPDAERRGVVAETCRLRSRECVALLAHWQAERPGSPELAALVEKIRNHPDFGRSIPLGVVPTLVPLFGSAAPQDGGDPVLAAQRESDLFVRYYHHLAPFSRKALSEAFRACSKQSNDRRRCEEALRTLEAKLGPLDGR